MRDAEGVESTVNSSHLTFWIPRLVALEKAAGIEPLDIGNIQLKKLTPEEHEKYMKEGQCLRYRTKRAHGKRLHKRPRELGTNPTSYHRQHPLNSSSVLIAPKTTASPKRISEPDLDTFCEHDVLSQPSKSSLLIREAVIKEIRARVLIDYGAELSYIRQDS